MNKINKYQIIKRLGGGASSDVYLAYDPFLQIHVALKVLKPELLRDTENTGRVRHMFMNEARLVRELQHPYIMAILDAVQDEEHAYLVLEYVDGQALSNFTTPETLLPVATVMQIAFKCCMAMAYASSRGLVHRDLKPENLLLRKTGDLKISDFGVSQLANSGATQLTGMVGSPTYMSPEQIAERQLTAASDMFSLGVVLYQLLTGQRPFESDNLMTLFYKIAHTPHAPLSTHRSDLPSALERLIEIALEKRPEDRFPTWQAFADYLSVIDASLGTTQEDFSDREKFLALRKNPFFASFSDPQIWQSVRVGQWEHFKTAQVLMTEGHPGTSFSILLEGEVKVSKLGKVLSNLHAGASLGEMAFLKPEQALRSATIIAVTPIVAVKFSRAVLENASNDLRVQFERRFLQILVERLNITSERLAEV